MRTARCRRGAACACSGRRRAVHRQRSDRLERDRSVRGLHWRYRGLLGKMRNREYLIVSNDAPATTFVHELGHLFGLEHDTSQQNLMCSCRQGPRQIFTTSQGRTMRTGALAFVARQL